MWHICDCCSSFHDGVDKKKNTSKGKLKSKAWIMWAVKLLTCAYHIDELDESQTECHIDLLRHVAHRPDELVVITK